MIKKSKASPGSTAGGRTTLDLAYKFRGKPKIRGHHVLGYPLYEFGKSLIKMVIALFAGKSIDKEEVLLGSCKSTLDDQTKIAVQFRDLVTKTGSNAVVKDSDLRWLDSLNVKAGGYLPVKTLIVGDPPVFDGKLDDLLHSVLLDKIHPETTLQHKMIGRADLLFL